MNGRLAASSFVEGLGTFALVFVAILSLSALSVVGAPDSPATLVVTAFAQGLTIAAMVTALGAVSGGHFNPAITLGFVITGRMSLAMGLIYWVSQVVGAALAALLVAGMYGTATVAQGTPALGTNVGFLAGVVTEAVATFFLVLVVFGTAVGPEGSQRRFSPSP